MASRPFVTCHMITTLDGKSTGAIVENPSLAFALHAYLDLHSSLNADAFGCGRTTMEALCTKGFYPDLTPHEHVEVPGGDHIVLSPENRYAVAFDRCGKLGWRSQRTENDREEFNGAQIIEVLTDCVPTPYLAYLHLTGVSYIFAGASDLEVSVALEKLNRLFGIKHLVLEGGSVINGAFLADGCVDAISLLAAPALRAPEDKPLFAPDKFAKLKDLRCTPCAGCLHIQASVARG